MNIISKGEDNSSCKVYLKCLVTYSFNKVFIWEKDNNTVVYIILLT